MDSSWRSSAACSAASCRRVRFTLTVGPGAGPGLSLVLLAIDAFQAASLVDLGVHPRLVHGVGLELGPGVSLVCGLFGLGLEASRLLRLRGLGLLTLPATLSANPVLAYRGPFEPIPVAAKCLYRDELPLPGDALVPSVGVCH
jgi:hypothetical protein